MATVNVFTGYHGLMKCNFVRRIEGVFQDFSYYSRPGTIEVSFLINEICMKGVSVCLVRVKN